MLRRVFLLLLLTVACGEPFTAAQLDVRVALVLQAANGSPVPLDGERVDVSVSGAGIDPPIFGSFRFTGDSALVELSVPIGRGRLVSVAVFDSSNVLVASGEALVDIGAGVSVDVPVPILPSTGDQPIIVTAGNITLTVNPGSLTLPPGDSAALSVSITDGQGLPIVGVTPSFASSNPGIASVSTTGMVKARVQGVTAVTVTALGVAARIPVSASQPDLRSP